MTDYQFVVIAALLAWVVYQLTALRRDQRLGRLDEMARYMCPHLYEANSRNDLRDWIALLVSTDDVMSREARRLGGWIPIEKKVSLPDRRWEDVCETWVARGHPCELDRRLSRDEREQLLEPAMAITTQFVRTLRASTFLTGREIEYLAYRAWSLAFAAAHGLSPAVSGAMIGAAVGLRLGLHVRLSRSRVPKKRRPKLAVRVARFTKAADNLADAKTWARDMGRAARRGQR